MASRPEITGRTRMLYDTRQQTLVYPWLDVMSFSSSTAPPFPPADQLRRRLGRTYAWGDNRPVT
jgi:hypothetical protein